MTYYIIYSLQLQAWKIITSLALKNIVNTKHHLISPRLPAASPPELEAREKLSPEGLWCSAHEHSRATSPGSLWFISPATTESILATPNYPDGWQVCLAMFCQYHLVLSFHPSLLLPAIKQEPTNHPVFWLGLCNSTNRTSQHLKLNTQAECWSYREWGIENFPSVALSVRTTFKSHHMSWKVIRLEKLTTRIKKKILAYLVWQQKGLVVFITKEWGMVQL